MHMKNLRVKDEPKYHQAQKIIARFGNDAETGVATIARMLGISRQAVYLWMKPKAKRGTDGRVPAHQLTKICEMAPLYGVLLTPEDLDPR